LSRPVRYYADQCMQAMESKLCGKIELMFCAIALIRLP